MAYETIPIILIYLVHICPNYSLDIETGAVFMDLHRYERYLGCVISIHAK